MGSLVAVDGGQSRCRAAVIGADGRPCPVAEGPGLPPGAGPAAVDGIVEVVTATVTSAVVGAAAASHEVGQVEMVSAGLAGLLGTRDVAPAVAARPGALPDPDGGVVVAAGTGAVAFGAVPVRVPEPDGSATEGIWHSPST